ncbi:dihydropteroate synthase [Egicoccus sp. AB-alg6-2]|uniref:dihydropteroate synthase n=1 Tax=Egicoccus sp. AB-alg6-2 TaxID=3242692 RepID=UPI00359E8C45
MIDAPLTRVEEARLVPAGGPARLALSRLPRAGEIADAAAAARGVSAWVDGRLVVTAVPSRLIDAAGRVGGRELADLVAGSVEPAVEAWLGTAPDLPLPGRAVLPTATRPVVMGIVNVTPDSFADGGAHYAPDDHPGAALRHGRALLEAGADVLDVGGESTRPGADPIDVDEELRRVIPVVEALAEEGAVVSIDTTKARVAREAVAAGAAIVNDVSAGGVDDELVPTVAELGVAYVLMHRRGTPRTMQDQAEYTDVVGEVFDFLADRLDHIQAAGVGRELVVVDPGIGFAKTAEHNLVLLRRLREFTSLGRPVLIGTSRKAFLGRVTGATSTDDRVVASVTSAALAVRSGARIVRVHDVAETVQALAVAHAIATAGDEA